MKWSHDDVFMSSSQLKRPMLNNSRGEATRQGCSFVKEYGVQIDDVVMLSDPNNNVFEVWVDKKNGKVYLKEGWFQLKKFYIIDLGTWIKLTYAEQNLILMSIRNRSGVEIVYPNNTPPTILKLMSTHVIGHFMSFSCSAVHILNSSDIESGVLASDAL